MKRVGSGIDLGMGCPISRRDFVNGAAVAIGTTAALPLLAAAPATTGQNAYPPARTGIRGSHPGAFEGAHLLRDGQIDLSAARDTGETYDCVIVGAGLSGLASAHFLRKSLGQDPRILIFDNHDDFGGHAKRNEFMVDGRLLVVNGGTMNIESPARYNEWARDLLNDIGVDLARFEVENRGNAKLYASLGLGSAVFFGKEEFGRDRLVRMGDRKVNRGYSPEFLATAPLTGKARADLLRILADNQPDYLAGMSVAQKKDFLARTSLADYYLNTIKIDPQAFWFFQHFGEGNFCVGADANPALFGWVQNMPGFSGLGLGPIPQGLFEDLPGGQHGKQLESGKRVHFPDGNATLARLLVAHLILGAVPAKSQEDVARATVDYGTLDRADNATRIRLSSTVLNVRHDGDPASATEAVISYMSRGKLKTVRARNVIMACWNMMIPYIVPDMPSAQKEALAYGVKGPLVYTSVALRNWRAFAELGVASIDAPGGFHRSVALTEAVGLGGLHFARTPDEPVCLHLTKTMTVPGLPKRDQHRAGRAQLLELSFETFERETRRQLQRILATGGFDAARDIAGISVNRWPHGYAYTYNSLYDPAEWCFSETEDRPCVKGRKPWGLIAIANSDAAASPHTDAAILEAHRSVAETVERMTYPFARRT